MSVLPVRYKKPRAINLVTVVLVLAVVALGYAAWEFTRVLFLRQEAYRVLEETSSAFYGGRSLYLAESREREALERKMMQRLREIGISDPDAETWIEVEQDGAHFGVVYTAVYHWPLDVFAPIRRDVQIEHVSALSP